MNRLIPISSIGLASGLALAIFANLDRLQETSQDRTVMRSLGAEVVEAVRAGPGDDGLDAALVPAATEGLAAEPDAREPLFDGADASVGAYEAAQAAWQSSAEQIQDELTEALMGGDAGALQAAQAKALELARGQAAGR